MEYSIDAIREMTGAKISSLIPSTIRYISTDSRSVSFPEETLFFALHTQRNNGHKYIKGLYQIGVRSFVVSEPVDEQESMKDANFLLVNNTLTALQMLAAKHRELFDIPLIGITGSNGKTIVKEWLYQLLHTDIRVTRSPRSYNSQIGVPLSMLMLNDESQLGIFEAGISQSGEMQRLEKVIRPKVGILTNIGEAHQENFHSLQEKCIEKCALFKGCDLLIYCSDNVLINRSIKIVGLTCKMMNWSRKDPSATVYISSQKEKNDETEITYIHNHHKNAVLLPFTDEASIENAIHCLTYLLFVDLPENVIAHRMHLLEPVAMRLEVKEGKNNCLLIDDSYNSDLNSLAIALDFQARRTIKQGVRRTVILSDILQSGMPSFELYAKVNHLLVARRIDRLIGIGPQISAHSSSFQIQSDFFPDTKAFLGSACCRSFRDEVILVKGARSFHFEDVFEQLSLKVHETILEVNLNNLVENFNYYRSRLKPQTKIVAMVKAFAYGAGSYEIAKTLQDQRCDYLAVAVADEGAELRKCGIYMPLMVMNPEMNSLSTLFDNSLEPEVYSFKLLHALIEAAERQGIFNYPIHLKLDTGMHRLGFTPDELSEVVSILKNQKALMVRSVFSHLAGSDSPQLDYYTKQQVELFTQCTDQLQAVFSHKIIRHILNTAGIERFAESQMEMVRLGIGLYGITSNPAVLPLLKNVSTLKTTILQIRELSAEETVGYGRRGALTRKSRIAAIPIGYADGLNRLLGNRKGSVYVNGKFAPIVGNVCMDVTMIDVTDIPAREGDPVIVFGEEQSVAELADKLGTIPYEVITSISNRVKRVYYQE